jgi:hypothetical protein
VLNSLAAVVSVAAVLHSSVTSHCEGNQACEELATKFNEACEMTYPAYFMVGPKNGEAEDVAAGVPILQQRNGPPR